MPWRDAGGPPQRYHLVNPVPESRSDVTDVLLVNTIREGEQLTNDRTEFALTPGLNTGARAATAAFYQPANLSAIIEFKGETMPTGTDLLGKFEENSPAGIRAMLATGVSPTEPIKGTLPINALIEMYLRSSRF